MKVASKQRMTRALTTAVAFCVVIAAGCGESDAPETPAPSITAVTTMPPPITIDSAREGLLLRYLDPASGAVETAVTLEDVPEAARKRVVAFDTNAPPPAGWDHVVDLSGGLPATSRPQAGFSFKVRAASSGVAKGPGGAAGADVVMFSTEWCGPCKTAKKFFAKLKVPMVIYDIEKERSKAMPELERLAKKAGVPRSQLQGVPILFVNNSAVVGWDERRVRQLLRI